MKKHTIPLQVIFDSSFLFIPSQFKIDIFEEMEKVLNRKFDPIITTPTCKELQKIADLSSSKLKQQATMALKFAEKCRKIHVEKGRHELHDDVLVRVASEMRCCVATNDRDLKKRIRKLGLPVIYLRQKSHLVVEGAV
jgi:rRNA-processing protein FCF1